MFDPALLLGGCNGPSGRLLRIQYRSASHGVDQVVVGQFDAVDVGCESVVVRQPMRHVRQCGLHRRLFPMVGHVILRPERA